MEKIQRPKKVNRVDKNYLTNEKYQDYAETQFKNIYDYLDKLCIEDSKVYYSAWSTSITFNCPIGHHALMLCSYNAVYLLWNPEDNYHTLNIVGQGYTLTRDNTDRTKFTLSSNNNNAYTIIVF